MGEGEEGEEPAVSGSKGLERARPGCELGSAGEAAQERAHGTRWCNQSASGAAAQGRRLVGGARVSVRVEREKVVRRRGLGQLGRVRPTARVSKFVFFYYEYK
jgi:hypothetical protein